MKKITHLLTILLITALSCNTAKAQYTMLTDFTADGSLPELDQNLITDGTYLYGMSHKGGANGFGTTFKIKISDNTYTKIFDFAGATSGSYPSGSSISDGIYLYGMTGNGGTSNLGTAFKIKISDNSYTKILDFAGAANGSNPFGSLTSNGTYLYGMTSGGGANNLGTAFKIKISDNTYTKILDFNGATNGSFPRSSLTSDGTYLYGMTDQGGVNGMGTVFKIKISDNSYTKILDFAGATNGMNTYSSLTSDGTYLYGMTYQGGANAMGTAFKIKISDNSYTKILDFAGATNGRTPYGSLTSDGTYLYGMTKEGCANCLGTANFGTAFKIKISDNSYTKILDFAGVANGSNPYGSLTSDGTYLYGMAKQGGANNLGIVFKIKISDNSYSKILDFPGATNGRTLYGSLTSDGTYLYGMTFTGGANNLGIVYKIKISDNTYTKILDFAGASNGKNPYCSLTTDGTYLYGMTTEGGGYNSGIAFKIKISDNSYTKIFDYFGLNAIAGKSPFGSFTSDGTYLYGMTAYGGANNLGIVFKIKISDNSYTKILDFTTNNGSNAQGSLISDGTYMYGMASQGGAYNFGTLFKINISDNTYTKILNFSGATNGSNPYGSLISDGTYLYGMTFMGGANDMGTVFIIKISDNSYTKILDFAGATNGSLPNGSLTSDGTFLYGMTGSGGANNSGTLFKIKISDNTYTKLIDFAGISNGSGPRGQLVIDGSFLFGTTAGGGSANAGTVFKYNLSISKATPIIIWSNPASITSNIPLSSLQLNATANVAGTFAYTPPAGTLLSVGTNQTLSVVFTPADATNYTSANKTVQINVTPATGINELSENLINVFPNPGNEMITISGLSDFLKGRNPALFIMDILGKTILTKRLDGNTSSETILIGFLPKGVYFICMQTDTERVVKRFVKQ